MNSTKIGEVSLNSNILLVTASPGHAQVHFTSLHHKINYNSQVHTHCCGRYFTVVDDFIKQFLCREGLGKIFLVQQTYKITTLSEFNVTDAEVFIK